MFCHEVKLRVRYAETDQMQYVYYGNYAIYYEVARVECLRALGISYKRLEDDGVMLPVLEQYTKYIAPAHYDDLLTIRVSVKEMPQTRISFEYEIFNEAGRLLNIGKTTLVFVNKHSQKPIRCPKDLAVLFKPHFSSKT